MIVTQLKNRRRELNLSQQQLAELADLSINTVYKMEIGDTSPTLDTLEKIANTLGMEIQLTARKHNMY